MYTFGRQILNSPIGVIPGKDINAEKYNRLASRGASIVEIGPVSPQEQNLPKQKKRLFGRQPAVRYDVSNKGVKHILEQLQKKTPKSLILANITYNAGRTMVDDVVGDITKAFSLLYDFVDAFVIDTFRMNGEGSPMLQQVDFLSEVIDSIVSTRACYEEEKPIYIRVAPNIPDSSLVEMLDYARMSGVEGMIVGYDKTSLKVIKRVNEITLGRFPVAASGHTGSIKEALDLFKEGNICFLQTEKRLKKISKAIQEGQTLL